MAAWPAAVAASLERFRSASVQMNQKAQSMKYDGLQTCFLLSFNIGNNCFNLGKVQALNKLLATLPN